MKGGTKLIIVALVVTGLFTWFAQTIPQTAWEAPKKQVITQDMTPRKLADIGKELFKSAGCGVCHSVTGEQLRGPDLSRIGSEREVDTMATFMYYGSAVMPPANKPPANLNDNEITSVVAYLQSLGGRPTVKIGDVKAP
ncbi:MAG TPA: cytochrome c [Thermodesulfovibrionia bacterium]|nr:cytochrome c [Thermodesulfovibrionia bacterium]